VDQTLVTSITGRGEAAYLDAETKSH